MPVSGTRTEYNRRDYRRAAQKVARGHKCRICGKPADTAHHLKDIAKGGKLKDGLAPLCRECNGRLGGKMSPKRKAVGEALRRKGK